MLDYFLPQIFLGVAQQRLFRRGIPVLTYHYVSDQAPHGADPFLYVTPRRLDEQLAALRAAGYSTGTLSDILSTRENDEKKVVITFDDGSRNVFENAIEILGRHQFRAVQFIVANSIGQRNEWDIKHGAPAEPLMDAAQIREWLAAGHDIGSHSSAHPNLSHRSEREAREQIAGSKKSLEDRFGIPIHHFAYPHGKWNPSIRDLVAEAGYTTACTTKFGINTHATGRFELNRITPLSSGELIGKAKHRLLRKMAGR